MELMECPECEAVFGGPSLAAFGCCPTCLAEQRFVRLRPCDDAEPATPFRSVRPRAAGTLVADEGAGARFGEGA